MNTKLYVYIITCDGGNLGHCYYVGTWGGDCSKTRFLQHKNKLGSKFTQKYPPISFEVVGVFPTSVGMRVENETTVRLIRQYGFRRVRGGNMLNMKADCYQLSSLQWWLPHELQKELLAGVLGDPDPVF